MNAIRIKRHTLSCVPVRALLQSLPPRFHLQKHTYAFVIHTQIDLSFQITVYCSRFNAFVSSLLITAARQHPPSLKPLTITFYR